jgi:hypothetical protein
VGTVILTAFTFCVPKFFESKITEATKENLAFDVVTNLTKKVSFRKTKG